MNNERITLVTVKSEIKDQSGFKTGEDTKTVDIFCNTKSVGRQEYYAALSNGYKVSIIFEITPDDFKLSEAIVTVDEESKKVKASKVVYADTTYIIRRTYCNNLGLMELTCEEDE